jgi:hypothetical protein
LKRLAEIVSAQAIAQQERLEYDGDDDEHERRGQHALDDDTGTLDEMEYEAQPMVA